MLFADELGALVYFGLMLYALFDCITAPDVRNLPKITWVLIILALPLIGSILYLVAGRPERERHVRSGPAFTTGLPAGGPPPRHQRSGPIAPDDDPAFLASVEEGKRRQQRLDAWEADLARREREMKREDPDGPQPV